MLLSRSVLASATQFLNRTVLGWDQRSAGPRMQEAVGRRYAGPTLRFVQPELDSNPAVLTLQLHKP